LLDASYISSGGSGGTTIQPVPAPELAAAARAAGAQDNSLLGFAARNALPGLLVAIATAIVGFVAAGNLKAFAPKLAGMRSRLDALDARAKELFTTASGRLTAQVRRS
jgi:hypothetical protein